jgi:hypothetical protein
MPDDNTVDGGHAYSSGTVSDRLDTASSQEPFSSLYPQLMEPRRKDTTSSKGMKASLRVILSQTA